MYDYFISTRLHSLIIIALISCISVQTPTAHSDPYQGYATNHAQHQLDNLASLIAQLRNKGDNELANNLERFQRQGSENPLRTQGVSSENLIRQAESYLGIPHCMGGSSRRCMDCSGLLKRTFSDLGIVTPHGSEAMARYGKIIVNPDELRFGDLIFFVRTYRTSKVITHSGFYMGQGDFIHVSTKKGVEVVNLYRSRYWTKHYIFGTRIK